MDKLPVELKNKILIYISFVPFDKYEFREYINKKKINIISNYGLKIISISNSSSITKIKFNTFQYIYEQYKFNILDNKLELFISNNCHFMTPLLYYLNNYNIKYINNKLKDYDIEEKKYIYHKYVKNSKRLYRYMTKKDKIKVLNLCILKLY